MDANPDTDFTALLQSSPADAIETAASPTESVGMDASPAYAEDTPISTSEALGSDASPTDLTTLLSSRLNDAVDMAARNPVRLERHPLSKVFPDMPEDEQSALTEDMKIHGQRQPIILKDEMVIDGWHRYVGLLVLNIEPKTANLPDDVDPVAYVLSANIHRRHLDATQRAAAVTRCAAWAQSGENQHTRGGAATSPPADGAAVPLTNAEMAEVARVSVRTIQQCKAATAAGLGDALRDGIVTAERAAEIAKLPEPDRAAALAAPKAPKGKATFTTVGEVPVVNLRPPKLADLLAENKEFSREIDRLTVALNVAEATIKTLQVKCARQEMDNGLLRAIGTSATVERVDQTGHVDLPVAVEGIQDEISQEDVVRDVAVMDDIVLEEVVEVLTAVDEVPLDIAVMVDVALEEAMEAALREKVEAAAKQRVEVVQVTGGTLAMKVKEEPVWGGRVLTLEPDLDERLGLTLQMEQPEPTEECPEIGVMEEDLPAIRRLARAEDGIIADLRSRLNSPYSWDREQGPDLRVALELHMADAAEWHRCAPVPLVDPDEWNFSTSGLTQAMCETQQDGHQASGHWLGGGGEGVQGDPRPRGLPRA